MKYIRHLDSLRKENVALAGGKGASLGEMISAGIAVPTGFVVLSDVSIQYSNHAKEIEEEILAAFDNLDMDLVAVRSSATAEDGKDDAWAGQLDTFLNVQKNDLIEKIKACWASIDSQRAIAYRSEKGMTDASVSVAVVVQKMVDAEKAGVAFSVHPVTQNKNEIVIEAVEGLGESLVSGKTSPDSYVVSKDSNTISSKHIQSEQLLSDDMILELALLVKQIEHHYGFPCDIEWAHADGTFFILQSRPITTLSEQESTGEPYRLIFSSEGYTAMNAFNLQFAGYIEKGGAIVCENNERVDLYIKEHDLALYGKAGLEIFSSRLKTNELITDIDRLIDMLAKHNNQFDPEKMDSYSNEELAAYYEASMQSTIKFLSLYCLLESHHTVAAENIISNYMQEHSDAHGESTLFDAIYAPETIADDHVREIAENIKTLAAFKLAASEKAFAGKRGVLKEIKSRIGLADQDDIQILSWKEIHQALLNEIDHDTFSKLQEERKSCLVIFSKNNDHEVKIQTSIDAKKQFELIKDNLQTNGVTGVDNENFLKGQPASSGRHKGRAVVVPYITDSESEDYKKAFKDFKQGDILVTKNTVPEIIALIRKAGAIVTEEGGITCHGAVVAREFKLPAIVGAQGATEKIKTGDMIEVDTKRGGVVIIKK